MPDNRYPTVTNRRFLSLALLLTSALAAHAGPQLPPLSGSYTIGGTSPDYPTFTAAVADLAVNGVSGAVVFNVRPGTYSERITINAITGASAANTITFQAENGDSSSVTLISLAGTDQATNYTLRLNGADYLRFRQLTLSRQGTQNYSTVIELTGGADNNQFISNRIMGPVGQSLANTDGSRSGVFSPTGSNEVNNVFRNNFFQGNANGIWYNGAGTSTKASGTVVESNVFETFYVGVFLLYQDGPVIRQNQIRRSIQTASGVDYFGISLRYCEGAIRVLQNQVAGYDGNYGIRLREANGTAANPVVIANNFVQVGGSGTSRGISLEDNSTFVDVYYNSVNLTGTSATLGRAMNIVGSTTNGINVVNNSFANTGGGYAYYVPSGLFGAIPVSNYNNLYTTGSELALWGSNAATLAALRAASGKEANSVSGNPQYVSLTDLHSTAAILSNAGTPLAAVTDDIDGQTRSTTTPDIGADESGVAQVVDAAVMGVFPQIATICAGTSTTYTATIMNNGNGPLSNVPVQLRYSGPVNGLLQATLAGPVAPNQNASVAFPFLTLTQSGVYTFVLKAMAPGDNTPSNDSLTFTLTVEPLPNVQLGNDTTIQAGDSLVLNAGGAGVATWQDGSNGSTFTVTQAGTYFVTVVNAAGCTASDTIVVSVITGLAVATEQPQLQIYPNPAQQFVTISLAGISADMPVSLQLIDLTGRVIWKEAGFTAAALRQKQLPLQAYPAGLYLLRLQLPDKELVRQVVKQ